MAGDTAALLDELGVCGADVVGWSDGGILALLLARDRPELVRRAVPISANVSSAPPPPAAMPQDALDWVRDHGDESITLPAGREELPGAPEAWPAVVRKLQAMWLDDPGISLTDLSALSTPVLYLAGDQDVVRAEHTLAMFQATPGAQLGIVPGATHLVPQTHAAAVAALIERFLAEE